MHAFTDMSRGSFAPVLLASLIDTSASPWKFDRFAKKVLGAGYPGAQAGAARRAARDHQGDARQPGQNNPLRKLYPVHEGFGRTDALGRIGNTAFGDHLVAGNYQAGDAPVSYPYLWNIWKFDWVQYNGSVSQPLARNIGEALGVGAIAPLRTDMLEAAAARRSATAARWTSPACTRIEHTLQHAAAAALARGPARARSTNAKAGARQGAVRTALPRLPRPARRGSRARSRRARRSSLRRMSNGASK